MRWTAIITTAFAASLIAGCAPALELPASFVELGPDQSGRYYFKAVSADGVVIALRRIDNSKNATVEFWAKALENELTWSGHSLVENVPVTSEGGTAGRLMTFSGQREGQEFTYILGVFVKGGSILLTEAGGKADAFGKHKAEIGKSLLSVR